MKDLIKTIKASPAYKILHTYYPCLINFLLSFSLTLSMVYFPVTSFGAHVSDAAVIIFCVIFSAFFTVVSTLRHYRIIYGAASALMVLIALCFRSQLVRQSINFYLYAKRTIDEWSYGSGESVKIPSGASVTFLIVLFSFCTAFLFSWVITRRRSLLWLTFIAAPLNILCHTVQSPSTWCTLLFTGTLAILILTHSVRKHDSAKGAKLSVQLSLPLAILAAVILCIFPESGYDENSMPYSLKYDLEYAFICLGSDIYYGIFDTSSEDDTVYDGTNTGDIEQWADLETLGPLELSDEPVMSVYVEKPGTYYLRGFAFSLYQDNSWFMCTADDLTDMHLMPPADILPDQQENDYSYITIETYNIEPILFFPYYSTSSSVPTAMFGDAYLDNTEWSTEYTIEYTEAPYGLYDESYLDFAYANCTYLPEGLREELLKIAKEAGIRDAKSNVYLAYQVESYIKNAAVYDLNATPPPEGSDPILYFLTESRRGYCVHFASACTAMLRALGVPARFVTGYAFSTEGNWAAVLGKHAHAWTEYYNPYYGWMPLEPTGSSRPESDIDILEQDITEPTETQPTTTTVRTTTSFVNAQPSGIPRTSKTTSAESASGSAAPTDYRDGKASSVWLTILPFALLAVAVIADILASRLIDTMRERAMSIGSAKERAVACWKYIRKLETAMDIRPDEELLAVVMKAQFSKNGINSDELKKLTDRVSSLREKLISSDSFFKMLLNRYIHFLY